MMPWTWLERFVASLILGFGFVLFWAIGEISHYSVAALVIMTLLSIFGLYSFVLVNEIT